MASKIASLTEGLSPQEIAQERTENHDGPMYVCAVVFTVLAIFSVVVRVTSRHMKKVAVGLDDYLVIFALVRFCLCMKPFFPLPFTKKFLQIDSRHGTNYLHLCR